MKFCAFLALSASFAALSGACSGDAGPDLTLTAVAGSYSPIVIGGSLSLTATFASNIINTQNNDNYGNPIYTNTVSGNVQASLLSSLNPLLGETWSSAGISVNSTDLVLTQNPGAAIPTEYSIALSEVTPGNGAPITYFHSETQLGQSVSDPVSSGCEELTTEYLTLDTYSDHFDANIVERTVFNNISPTGGAQDVTCAQLFAQVQADLRAGSASAKNQLFAVFVTNGVISVDQIASLQELDISASLTASKTAAPVASDGGTAPAQATGKNALQSDSLKRVHAAILGALKG